MKNHVDPNFLRFLIIEKRAAKERTSDPLARRKLDGEIRHANKILEEQKCRTSAN